nr:piggyBac transposable element-derived protein 4-like [Leptinotarsa decemlineata]
MIQIIVDNTNLYMSKIAESYSKERRAKPTDVCEIKSLLGLLYLAGTLKSSRLNTKELWERNETGVERFWLVMSRERFHFLLRCIRFDNIDTREKRRQLDKLAPIRTLFDYFVENCKEAYTIGLNATIDEKLEAFRGRCSFKQYIPTKPNRYGICALVGSQHLMPPILKFMLDNSLMVLMNAIIVPTV